MADFDPLNAFLQNLRCQLLEIGKSANRRIDPPATHASRQCPQLIQHIGIQHLVIDDVGLWTFIRAAVVVGAEVDVRCALLQLLPRQGQRMTAAVAEQQSTK